MERLIDPSVLNVLLILVYIFVVILEFHYLVDHYLVV